MFSSKLVILSLLFTLSVKDSIGLLSYTLFHNENLGSDHLHFESDSINQFIIHDGFVVKYDFEKKCPLFTIHTLTPYQLVNEDAIKAKRANNYMVVEYEDGRHSANDYDYKNSGWSRGHLVPAGDFYWQQNLKYETNTYLNIAPFNTNLNSGYWSNLEHHIRQKVIHQNSIAFIITGAIFPGFECLTIGENNVAIPSSYYKIIYFPETSEMYAFHMDNMVGEFAGWLSEFQVTVDFIEQITNEDFFDKLEDTIEEELEGKVIKFRR